MSNTRIIEIPATMQTGKGKNHAIRKLRVAAYCRVSTEEEEQQSSFETQKLYYTEKITSTPEWEIAGIYADDGISGVHTKKRDGFNQMIQDCKKRKIDLILTKSISRFARNTLDSIQYVRMLKALGIAVIFEKENINTSTMNSEMILTVLSAFAQAESESISQNVARGKRMGFRQGKFPFPYRQILGYRKGSDGKPEIIPEEAEVIRMIFNSYLQGASLQTIKKRLEADGVLTARGNKKWSSESVQRILQNEKYCGDVLLQKTFIEDVLTGVSKKNTGQLPQYYIENVREETFYMPNDTIVDLIRTLIWYDWEHSLPFQDFGDSTQCFLLRIRLSCSHPAVKALLADWQIHRTAFENGRITSSDYLEWMLQWPPTLSAPDD